MVSQIEVYPGELVWTESVPCQELPNHRFKPREELPAPFNCRETAPLCFLNESRTRYGRYEIPRYALRNYRDDGPANLDQIVEACRLIEDGLKSKRKVVVYVPKGPQHAAHRNFSALCTAAHAVLARGMSARDAAKPWQTADGGSAGVSFFVHSWAAKNKAPPERSLTMEHCLAALEAARDHGWLSLATFDTKKYLELWHTYDLVWLVPGKVQVLGDPMSTVENSDPATASHLTPEDSGVASVELSQKPSFTDCFKENNVKLLIRLNYTKEEGLAHSYDPDVIKKHGIGTMDTPFEDHNGAVPHQSIVARIIARCDKVTGTFEDGSIAFHCKAGFGRSVTCASTWLAYHYDLPGTTAFAWSRLCRPGAITSSQQASYLMKLKGRRTVEEMVLATGCCSLQ